jgi:chorismate synthase
VNSFGKIFRITSFGESHGRGIGCVVDGCPAGLKLDMDAIQHELNRRKPGQNNITTQRKEDDRFEVLSGVVGNVTTGAPMAFMVWNQDQRSKDYDHIENQFRPSHADYTYFAKYGVRDHRGGGRSSARETIARVIGGSVARQLLAYTCGMQFLGWVSSVSDIEYTEWPTSIQLESEDSRLVACPDAAVASQMVTAIRAARKAGDSLGGVVSARVSNVPAGLGEPIYHKMDAVLASAMMSINAVKGFEVGSGFAGTKMRGSTHNDVFYNEEGRIRTRTNRSGGIQGGISNGEDLLFRVAFKPTSTIMQDQESVDADGNAVVVKGKGRHDPCVVPRAVPVVEAMAAMVCADMWLLGLGSKV